MIISPIAAAVPQSTDLAGPIESSGPTYEKAVQDFEAVLVSMMIKQMRQSLGEGFFGGDKADAMGGIFDMTLGDVISQQGGLGVAAALTRYRDVAEQHTNPAESGGLP